jgi:hypothetical protein
MILEVTIPAEPFNKMVRDGAAGARIKKILDAIKPEAAYFTEQDGHRGAMLIVDLKDPSGIPALAEPWYLSFNAECRFRVVMSPEDLGKSKLDQIAKGW